MAEKTIQGLENAVKSTGAAASSGLQGLAGNSTAAINTKNATKIAEKEAGIELNKQYASPSGARLVSFNYSEGGDDSERRAFFQLIGDTSKLKSDIKGDEALTAILNNLDSATSPGGFTSFILTGITENHQEKQSVMPTINDYFVATFSGHEPQIVNISGILPFDISTKATSWYINYLNAYTFLFRASTLAKYKLQLKLILNDFSTYICYPTSFTSGVQATQDNLVQFQMSALVAQEDIQKAKGISLAAKTASNTAEKVAENEALAKSQQSTGGTNTPASVGNASTEKNILEKATDWCNTVVTGVGTDKTALAINSLNRIAATAKTAADFFVQTTGSSTLRNAIRF